MHRFIEILKIACISGKNTATEATSKFPIPYFKRKISIRTIVYYCACSSIFEKALVARIDVIFEYAFVLFVK